MPRPPKYSPEARRLQGNPGNRRPPVLGESEDPERAAVPLAPPVWLDDGSELGAVSRQVWDVFAAQVGAGRVYRDEDQALLARYCRYVAEWMAVSRELAEHLRATGRMTVLDDRGVLRAHPGMAMRGRIESAIQRLEGALALQPSSRLALAARLAQYGEGLTDPRQAARAAAPVMGFLEVEDEEREDD